VAIQKNSINKLIAELIVPEEQDAAKAQRSISSFLKSEVLPLIEQVADRLIQPGEIIRIDRLEIELEDFVPGGSNVAALQAFEQKLEEELRRLISPVHHLAGLNQAAAISSKEADEELFIFLLREGYLPWWAKTTEPVILQELATRVLAQAEPPFKTALRTLVLEIPARKRIAYQLPLALIEQLLQLICREPDALLNLMATVKSLAARLSRPGAVLAGVASSEIFWRMMAEQALTYTDTPPDPGAFVLELIRSQQRTTGNASADTIVLLEKVAEELQIVETSRNPLKPESSNDLPVSQKKLQNQSEEEVTTEKRTQPAGREADPLKWMEEAAARENEYFVKNAGLIILAPYLPSFFKSLSLMQENQFVSPEAQQRAVCLLQYLSTGNETSFEEHDMLLNKTLCGLNLLTPLTLQFNLQEQEREECRALLQAVVSHWTALKSTSPESMRDSFFMREGVLESHANGWNLKIERTTLDVLVDKLPWGISIVKMPWSTEIIFVNW
jgi:hypothetical protein